MELPRSCTLRFPSTTLKISFQSLVESEVPPPPPSMVLPPKYAKPVQPLMISVPPPPRADVPNLISPCPSPTGTISAANSCPTSPRSSGSSVRSMLALDLPSAAAAAAFARNHSSCDDMKEPLPYGTISTEEEVSGGGGGGCEKSKPPYSYAQLIVQAITSHPDHQLTLSGIYGYISKHYPYYKATDKGWQNSIRHNLSLNRFFVKVPRSQEEPGKGSFWRIDSSSEGKLMEQAFRRRRQRVSCFRSPVGGDLSSRSAPVSPSHYDSSFTPEGTPHSAGLMPDVSGAGDADAEVRQQDSKSLESQPVTVAPPASNRLLQLTNDLRFIQSAPVSPQGGPVQLMALPNAVVAPSSVALSRTAAGVAFHPLSTLAGKQGVYLLQQTAPGGATMPTTVSLTTGVGVANANNKETDKSLMLKSVGNGNMLQTDAAIAQPQLHPPQRLCTSSASALSSASVSPTVASNSSLSPSSASMFSQLPITFIQPGSGVQSNDLIQKLLRQGAMVVGRMPEEGQSPSVYSLPQGVMQPGFQPFHVVLGTQLVKPGDAMANVEQGKRVVQPQIVVLPGTQGFKIEKLSPPVKLSNSTSSPSANQTAAMPEKSDASAEDSLSKGIAAASAATKDGVSAFSEAEIKSEKKDDAVGSIASLSSEVGASLDQIHFVGLSSTCTSSSYSAKDSTSGIYADHTKADKRPASVDEVSFVQSVADKRLRLDGDQ